MEDKLEKLVEKHELMNLNVYTHDIRIVALEKKAVWLEDEIVKGRESIMKEFKFIRDKLDLLHDDKVKRDGYEASRKDHESWKRWAIPVIISSVGIISAIVMAVLF